jgi:dienelactone hydrolase
MNEKGISIGEMGSRCKDESFEGIPMIFMLREALRRANTLDEALTFVREAKRTCGYNFIFADGKIPDAAAIEVTRSLFRAMRWNDPEGNTPPHSLIECAVRRVNHFVSPALAATQREVYDPAKSVAPSWIGYRLISDFITNNYGRLNDSKMIEMLRMYPPEHSCLHQAVFCPSDGVFWASMADDPAQVQFAGAQNQTFYRYDLKAILENRPFKALANKNPRSVLAQQPGLMEEGTVTAEQEVYRAQPNTEQFVPPSKTFKWKMVTIEQQPAYNAYLVTFLSPLESPFPCNNTVYGEYYRPNIKGKIPAVVVLHIAGGDFELSRFISRQLASNGIGALFIQMAYYGYRRPQGDRHVRMLSEDMDFTRDAVRQTVMDVRRAGVWLSLRPEVDSQKVGIVGASLGALVGSLVAGVDPRFQRNAFVLGGGDLAKIIWEGGETVREKKTLEEKGYTLESLRGKVKDVDPLTYAKNINPKGVLMINARFDTVIPPDCTTQLWKAMGEPTILWYDANHVNMLAYLFEVMNKVTEHFSAKNW